MCSFRHLIFTYFISKSTYPEYYPYILNISSDLTFNHRNIKIKLLCKYVDSMPLHMGYIKIIIQVNNTKTLPWIVTIIFDKSYKIPVRFCFVKLQNVTNVNWWCQSKVKKLNFYLWLFICRLNNKNLDTFQNRWFSRSYFENDHKRDPKTLTYFYSHITYTNAHQ